MTPNIEDLWIHQESIIISADSHDLWGFTPESLFDGKIVHDSWPCYQATRSADRMFIQYGPSHWTMTERELWITIFPDLPLSDRGETKSEDGEEAWSASQFLARNFLAQAPFIPSRRFWFFWRISAINPDRNRWMLENFLGKDWPPNLGAVRVNPQLHVFIDDLQLNITVRNETYQRRNHDAPDSTTFDCYISRGVDLTVKDMLAEIGRRTEWAHLLSRTLRHLMAGEGQ